jgi:glycosyltransferase involved in cell wall biosynthesis
MKRIAFFLADFGIGGAEKVSANLIQEMSKRGIAIDLVLIHQEDSYVSETTAQLGSYLSEIPSEVRVIDLGAERAIKAVLPFAKYLQQYKPWAVISHLHYVNVIAVLAKQIARTDPQLILVEHNTIAAAKSNSLSYRAVKVLMKFLYPKATSIVAVSQAASRSLEAYLGFAPERLQTIYNPVVNDQMFTKAEQSLEHAWFQANSLPVFLAVGRLTEQKDFPTLIKAFARMRQQKPARLLILGEGEQRKELSDLIQRLGLMEDVRLDGFASNPYAYMSRATAFILSSRWEGLPTVLIEAMACGCPVISTDCPSGPREILDSGRYGTLVPVGDEHALSQAMLQILEKPIHREQVVNRAIEIASIEKATSEYLALLDY